MDNKTFLVIATPIVIIVVTLGTALFFMMGFQDSETVLAGMLGFTGAIIGGAITLMGVKKTIEHGNEIEYKKLLNDKYKETLRAINDFGILQGKIYEWHNEEHRDLLVIYNDTRLELIKTNGLLDTSVNGGSEVYDIIEEFHEKLMYYLKATEDRTISYEISYSNFSSSIINTSVKLIKVRDELREKLKHLK